jgi:hypothetical protein
LILLTLTVLLSCSYCLTVLLLLTLTVLLLLSCYYFYYLTFTILLLLSYCLALTVLLSCSYWLLLSCSYYLTVLLSCSYCLVISFTVLLSCRFERNIAVVALTVLIVWIWYQWLNLSLIFSLISMSPHSNCVTVLLCWHVVLLAC